MKYFASVVTPNDTFVVDIDTHGDPTYLEIENGGTDLTYLNIQSMLEKIQPREGIFYLGACHSGAFIQKLNLPNYVIVSATTDHTYAWGDRWFSNGAYYFRALLNPQADTNVDGKITLREAFERDKIDAAQHWSRIDPYLKSKYHYGFGDYNSMKRDVSVEPNIIVGSQVSDQYWFVDVF